MSVLTWLIALVGVSVAGGWLFRALGQRLAGSAAAGPAPRGARFFRDLSFAVAVGYVLGALILAGIAILYIQGKLAEGPAANRYFFFLMAVEGFAFFAVSAIVFRALGRRVGPPALRKLFRQMPLTAAFGVLVILCYGLTAVFADLIAPHGQAEVFERANVVPGGDPALGGDPAFPLGTDQIGRDILSRLIFGAQNTVGIAFVTTVLAFLLGGSLGFLAATLRGWVDQVLSRTVDVLMAIPALIFALLLITVASAWVQGAGLTVAMILIMAVIDSTRVFRLARAVGMNIVVMDYIEAAKLRGERLGYIVFREILPNATAPLLAEFGLRFCFVFLTIAALSFLGVGIQPPLADWGTMVKDLATLINYAAFAPQAASTPLLAAGAIALLTVAVNFVVDWMLHRSSGLKE